MQKIKTYGSRDIPEDLRPLSCELDSLRDLLLQLARERTDGPKDGLIAVTRMLSGVTVEQWNDVAKLYGLQEWLALSLDESSCLNLNNLLNALEDLAHQSEHDPLTGLENRRAFNRKMQMEAERVERSNSTVSLVIIDIDNFKNVNDTYGHPCGDEVLCGLADVLIEAKRVYDVAARLGGEEFALLLPGASALKTKSMVERVLQQFSEQKFGCENHEPFSCTFSAGVACMNGRGSTSITQLMELADKALYEAKTSGKNCVHVARQKPDFEYDRSTMVHSNEKQFLFSGTD
ncbi:GGDEF domain-containing protein [Desulfovibrio subterraneus]|uniref:GGDEF domain-containing protein n=1 Tax=Desulfovibrio subterraneus TaxID=2718620 RepID=UPI0022B87A3B|nr:GGDEF domain-containing protein [Desulfovibrio subterraneus]WBF67928.1 GGDEF domain-containing protein [Desulfovibrio subterraneus]